MNTQPSELQRRDLAGQLLMPWADVTCERCGRLLTSETGQKRRMGRTCWRRRLQEEAKPKTEVIHDGERL